MRHLVIGQRQKAHNFSAFHWSPNGCLITIGQHFVTTRVVHLPKRTETSLITESDQSRANHQLLQLCTVRTAWSDLDQAVRAVHSCKSWFFHINTFISPPLDMPFLAVYVLSHGVQVPSDNGTGQPCISLADSHAQCTYLGPEHSLELKIKYSFLMMLMIT